MKEDDHSKWMLRALELASTAEARDEVPVGAVVVLNNQIIGEGFNQTISSSDPTAHAEIVALREAASQLGNYRLPGASLYVTIEPCAMCAGALIHARIEELVYGAAEPRAGAIKSQLQLLDAGHFNHKVSYVDGVLEAECRNLITDFFKAKRRQ